MRSALFIYARNLWNWKHEDPQYKKTERVVRAARRSETHSNLVDYRGELVTDLGWLPGGDVRDPIESVRTSESMG